MLTHTRFLLAGVAAAGLFAGATAQAAPSTGGSITAQSVQVHFEGVDAAYERTEAELYYFNLGLLNLASDFDTYFTGTAAGTLSSIQITTGKSAAFEVNRCKFWSGSTLQTVVTPLSLFPLKTYTATPKSPGKYPARTGWTLLVPPFEIPSWFTGSLDNKPVEVTVSDIFIAAESYVEKAKPAKNDWSRKFSFSMQDGASNSRLTELTIDLLYDDDPTDEVDPVIVDTRELGVDFDQTLETGEDWEYEGNGGQFGNAVAQLKLRNDQVSEILLSDDFKANNGIGGSRAVIEDQTYSLSDPGDYALRFRGVVKGNSFDIATDDQPFDVTVNFVRLSVCSIL
jgi:hypothetical protein